MQDPVDLQRHGLSGPLRVDLAEPAVNDGGVCLGSHFSEDEAWRGEEAGQGVKCSSYHGRWYSFPRHERLVADGKFHVIRARRVRPTLGKAAFQVGSGDTLLPCT